MTYTVSGGALNSTQSNQSWVLFQPVICREPNRKTQKTRRSLYHTCL